MDKIRNINVIYSNNNCCHKTKDNLRCDICGKKTNIVSVFKSSDNRKVIFVGFNCETNKNCFKRAFEEMFYGNDDESIECCQIEDIDFLYKKENKKCVRAKMTTKLRYEILKRDNFKCILCGRTPPEVSLVVDHINPVCNGGQSVKENLRTFCFDCNSGKGGQCD
jgi:5-methylcytosine-specific restriction endonuclease McrA